MLKLWQICENNVKINNVKKKNKPRLEILKFIPLEFCAVPLFSCESFPLCCFCFCVELICSEELSCKFVGVSDLSSLSSNDVFK